MCCFMGSWRQEHFSWFKSSGLNLYIPLPLQVWQTNKNTEVPTPLSSQHHAAATFQHITFCLNTIQVEGLYQVHIIGTAGYFWCAVPDQRKQSKHSKTAWTAYCQTTHTYKMKANPIDSCKDILVKARAEQPANVHTGWPSYERD